MCNSSGCYLSTLSGAPFACRPTKFGPAKLGSHNCILARTHCLSKLAVVEEGIRGGGIEIDECHLEEKRALDSTHQSPCLKKYSPREQRAWLALPRFPFRQAHAGSHVVYHKNAHATVAIIVAVFAIDSPRSKPGLKATSPERRYPRCQRAKMSEG